MQCELYWFVSRKKSGKPRTGLHCVIVLSQHYRTAVLHAMFQSIVVIDRPILICKLNIMYRICIYIYHSCPSSNLILNLRVVCLTNVKHLTQLTSLLKKNSVQNMECKNLGAKEQGHCYSSSLASFLFLKQLACFLYPAICTSYFGPIFLKFQTLRKYQVDLIT